MRRILIAAMVAVLLAGGVARPVLGQVEHSDELSDSQQGPAGMFGWGMAAVGTNLVYMPFKFLYAVGGGLVGLMAWGLSAGNSDVAKGILQPAFGGTWAITPEMLQGKQPIMVNGPSYNPR